MNPPPSVVLGAHPTRNVAAQAATSNAVFIGRTPS
jgi:hypothetical protein